MNESQFSRLVREYFNGQLKTSPFGDITVGERVNILTGFTFGKSRKGQWQIQIGFLQQDIVFYRQSDVIPQNQIVGEPRRRRDRNNPAPLIAIPSRGQQIRKIGGIVIPLLILELKIGAGVSGHQLLTYANIANQIRNIFPHCAYYFVAHSTKMLPETVLRHGKGFDGVFLDWEKEKDVIWEDVKNRLAYLQRIGVI
jgi:hypothetical protein